MSDRRLRQLSNEELADRLCAAAEMVPDLWTQGQLYAVPEGGDGTRPDCGTLFCAEGLVRLVTDCWNAEHDENGIALTWNAVSRDYSDAMSAMQVVTDNNFTRPLYEWNDEPDRTKKEVQEAFLAAAQELRARRYA